MSAKILAFLEQSLPTLKQVGLIGLKVLVILVVSYYCALFASKKLHKILQRYDETLANFVHQVVFVCVMIIGVIMTLSNIGVQTNSILAVLGAAGVAIALALKDSLSSIASGILLIVLRPFIKGDNIEIGAISGKVESINIFNTTLLTGDGKVVILPNKNIANSNIINQSKNPNQRIEIQIQIANNHNAAHIKEIIQKVLQTHTTIKKSPKAFVGVIDFDTQKVVLCIRAWISKTQSVFDTKSEIIEKINAELYKKGLFEVSVLEVRVDSRI